MARSTSCWISGLKLRIVPAQHRVVGDDVPGFAAVDLGDADDGRFARRHAARDDGLQRQHQLAGGDQCIDAEVGHRRVAAAALHVDFESAGTGHHRPGHHRHFADRNPWPVVQAVDRVHRILCEQAVFEHHPGAALRFLGGLENEVDGAVESVGVAVFGEVARGAEQHRAVAVVAAGVHFPRLRRAVREIVLFRERQRVEVGAQADGARAAAFAQDSDDAGLGQSAMDFEAIGGELARDQVGAARFAEREFGMGVQVAAKRD